MIQHLEAQVISFLGPAAAPGGRTDKDVLEDGHADERPRHLMRAGDAQHAAVGRASRCDVAAMKKDAAAVRAKRTGEHVQQGCLASAIGPDDADCLTLIQGKLHPVQNRQRSESLADVDSGQNRGPGLHA